jgi:hypothetical protein
MKFLSTFGGISDKYEKKMTLMYLSLWFVVGKV